MADPKKLSDLIKVTITIIKGSIPAGSVALACLISTFTVPGGWSDNRQKIYSGNPDEILAAMIADGIAETDNAYSMVEAYLDNEEPVDQVMVGRRDAGDASYSTTLNAIADEDSSFALVAAETRTKAEQVQIATWVESRWKYYRTLTRESGAKTKTAGTFVDAAFTAKYKKTAATWYDAATATGFGPVVITSAAGTFAIENGMTIVVSGEGESGDTIEKTITLAAAAATVLSSNTGPYVLADAQTILMEIDDADEITITLDDDAEYFPDGIAAATAAQLVDWLNDNAPQVTWSVDTNAVRATSQRKGTGSKIEFTGGTAIATIGFSVGATSGTGDFVFADVATSTELATKINTATAGTSQVTRGDVEFNGVENVGLVVDALDPLFVASDTDDDTTATALMNAWNASAEHAAVATASVDLAGTESYIILTFLDTLPHTVTSHSPDTADVTGITNTTAAVEALELTASASGTKFVIESEAEGEEATLELVSGTALEELGFEVGVYYGTGTEEDWHDCAVLGYLASMAAKLDLPGSSYPADNLKLRGRVGSILDATSRTNLRDQNCNTYEKRTANYPGELHMGVTFAGVNEDFVISTLWLELRVSEAVKNVQDRYTALKQRIPYSDPGITILDNEIVAVIQRWAASGAILGPDLTPYDPLTKTTGYTKPTIASQPPSYKALQKIGGWKTTQQDAGAAKIIEINIIAQAA